METSQYIRIALILLIGAIMATDITVAWEPQPGKQTLALTRSEYEILYGGARFGGKTEAGLAWMVEPEYISHPKYQGLVVRRNADDLSDWINRAQHFYLPLKAKHTGNPPIIRFPSGAIIRTGHLKDTNAYMKYQGHEYQKMLVEELTQIPTENDYEMLISSCRSTVPGLAPQVFATTNPGGPGHVWVKRRWVDVARMKTYWPEIVLPNGSTVRGRSRIFIPSKIDDNQIGMERDPNYVYQLESIKDDKLRKAWRDGNWDVYVGQFFDKWDPTVHVIKPFRLPPQWYHIRCLDWGYRAPAGVLWIAVDYKGNHFIYRELKQAGLEPSQLAKKVLRMTGPEENIACTPADPSIWAKNQYGTGQKPEQATSKAISDLLEQEGLFCQPANNDRLSGWANMKDLLYHDENCPPKLFVFDNCENFINDIPAMVHDDRIVEDCDTDGDDHLGDAARYGLLHTVQATHAEPIKSDMEKLIDEITEDPNRHIDGENNKWDMV